MRSLTIYNYMDYRTLLQNLISADKPLRGAKSRFARAAKCQPSYFSQVLSGKVHLTPEQALNLVEYLNLGPLESDFFLTLVDFGRAGTKSLKAKIKLKLDEIKSRSSQLDKVLNRPTETTPQHTFEYFRHWLVTAIHVMTAIKQYSSIQAIADRLRIPLSLAEEILTELQKANLVKNGITGWEFASGDIHISKDDPRHIMHHNNWRHVAMAKAMEKNPGNLLFTGICSGGLKEKEEFREQVVELIRTYSKKVGNSKPETVVCFCCDLFEL